MFYTFYQNCSGGVFDENFETGIAECVIIEAEKADDANSKAEAIGIYFGGVACGLDCECCGDRWYPASECDGRESPIVYSEPAKSWKYGSVCIHLSNGEIEAIR